MKIAVGSDEKRFITDYVIEELKRRGHQIELFGSLVTGQPTSWPKVGQAVAESVATGRVNEGILFCWTGTGVAIAANKVPGIRAALCFDAETARGARLWDYANVLVMSLRLTSDVVAKEILDAWFSTSHAESERETVKQISEIERKYSLSQTIEA